MSASRPPCAPCRTVDSGAQTRVSSGVVRTCHAPMRCSTDRLKGWITRQKCRRCAAGGGPSLDAVRAARTDVIRLGSAYANAARIKIENPAKNKINHEKLSARFSHFPNVFPGAPYRGARFSTCFPRRLLHGRYVLQVFFTAFLL